MGYAILMQWTLAPPQQQQPHAGRMGISDLVLSRILEHYNISHPMRSTIQLRTFRASFPTAQAMYKAGPVPVLTSPPTTTRVLTTVTHSLPIPHARDVPMAPGARDNVTYLFLEDRGVPTPAAAAGPVIEAPGGEEREREEDKEKEKKEDDKKKDGDKVKTEPEDKEKKNGLEDDGFEIIDDKSKAKDDAKAKDLSDEPMAVDAPAVAATRASSKYKILAVKPATLVMPTLHQLLSPFVLGLNKSARAAASTTAQAPAPTPLAGTPLMITTLTFPPTPHPQPSISLSVHILSNAAAQTIFLEAEWDGAASVATSRAILREFLLGCVPVDVPGEPRFMYWEDSGAPGANPEDAEGKQDTAGWYGVEKTRRITFLLAKALRESQFI